MWFMLLDSGAGYKGHLFIAHKRLLDHAMSFYIAQDANIVSDHGFDKFTTRYSDVAGFEEDTRKRKTVGSADELPSPKPCWASGCRRLASALGMLPRHASNC